MKNRATNNMRYTGIVTLSQYIGSKKIKISQVHNEGGNPLFEFLANCLIGDYTLARIFRPTQIMLLERTKQNGTDYSYSQSSSGAGLIYLLTRPEIVDIDGLCRVRYSFVIPKEVVNSITDFTNLYIGLYHDGASEDSPEDFSAICQPALSNTAVQNAALVVDWDLIISDMYAGV